MKWDETGVAVCKIVMNFSLFPYEGPFLQGLFIAPLCRRTLCKGLLTLLTGGNLSQSSGRRDATLCNILLIILSCSVNIFILRQFYLLNVLARYNFLRYVFLFVSLSILRIPGDWAGNSYATSGCPGTCEERLMDPTNFVVSTLFFGYPFEHI